MACQARSPCSPRFFRGVAEAGRRSVPWLFRVRHPRQRSEPPCVETFASRAFATRGGSWLIRSSGSGGRTGSLFGGRTLPSAPLTVLVRRPVDPCALRALPLRCVEPAPCGVRHQNPPNFGWSGIVRFVQVTPMYHVCTAGALGADQEGHRNAAPRHRGAHRDDATSCAGGAAGMTSADFGLAGFEDGFLVMA